MLEVYMNAKSAVLQGTLDLLVLNTLNVMGPMHGYGIAQRVQQISQEVLQLNQGTLYPALLRLEQKGWVRSDWGVSENNRRARYYSLTSSGREQLLEKKAEWRRVSGAIERLLEAGSGG
ncbi:MAG: PadR family transcriptional regulator [Acidobacteria bacterium]|nr:MAG: PadR family transcriptional regulator [Acidobacteriota bacterium]